MEGTHYRGRHNDPSSLRLAYDMHLPILFFEFLQDRNCSLAVRIASFPVKEIPADKTRIFPLASPLRNVRRILGEKNNAKIQFFSITVVLHSSSGCATTMRTSFAVRKGRGKNASVVDRIQVNMYAEEGRTRSMRRRMRR